MNGPTFIQRLATKRAQLKEGDRGFTLIELLVVVLILGIMSGIVVLAVSNSTADAKAKTCKQNALTLIAALDSYKTTSTALGGGDGTYPALPASTPAGAPTLTGYSAYDMTALEAVLVPKFIKSMPPSTEVWAFAKTPSQLDGTVAVVGRVTGCGNFGVN